MNHTNKKIIVSTICESSWIERSGLNKMLNSLKHFHPDWSVKVYNENDLSTIYKNNIPGHNLWSIMALTMIDAKRKTNADIVVHIDADSIILGKLDQILEDGYDIFAVRNDADDIGNRDESFNRPYFIKNLKNEFYLNCGFIATSSDLFLENWKAYNDYLVEKYRDIRNAKIECPIVEQGSYNLIIYGTKLFNTKLLDPIGSKEFWGPSANFKTGNGHCPEHLKKDYGGNNWESWYEIFEKDGQCYLNNKIVKILHQAGGGNNKLDFDMFNSNFIPYLSKLTKHNK